MRVLVTGANGFVGRHLVRALLGAKHTVVAACRPGTDRPAEWDEVSADRLGTVSLELNNEGSLHEAMGTGPEAIVHLAAISYSRDAVSDPRQAWDVNVAGTAKLLSVAAELSRTGARGPTAIITSSAEVYGEGQPLPRVETDALQPRGVYAASKLGAEAAAAHAAAAWGLPVIVVRPFPATGPGQTNRLVPNWLRALRGGQREVEGDAAVVRDYLDVRDTAAGYVALLARGLPGETYNLASGREIRFDELFAQLALAVGVTARLVPAAKPRREQQYLVGDASKLRQHTGWRPSIALERTITDLINA